MNKKTTIKMLIFVLIMILIVGCKEGKVHSKEEMTAYLDNLSCSNEQPFNLSDETTEDPMLSCKLRDNYTVINEEVYEDENGKVRKLDIKLNNEDFTFSVLSAYHSCPPYQTSLCYSTTLSYYISNDYLERAPIYFFNKYAEPQTEENSLCKQEENGYLRCYANNKYEIIMISDFLEGYLVYLNDLNFRVLSYEGFRTVDIRFPKFDMDDTSSWNNNRETLLIALREGKYVFESYNGEINETVTDVEQLLTDFSQDNDVFK